MDEENAPSDDCDTSNVSRDDSSGASLEDFVEEEEEEQNENAFGETAASEEEFSGSEGGDNAIEGAVVGN